MTREPTNLGVSMEVEIFYLHGVSKELGLTFLRVTYIDNLVNKSALQVHVGSTLTKKNPI